VITKAERAELRTLIRHRFKVLRGEVAQREQELLAELEQKIGVAYADEDRLWADIGFTINQFVQEANRKANDAIRTAVGREAWPEDRGLIRCAEVNQMRASSLRVGLPAAAQVRREGTARIQTTVKAASLSLDRQEVDLLTRLATGVLESEEARAFLAEIPTVSALVPAERLLELERSLTGDES
jgi:hypothetical protein